jgi:hypothetical protein
MKKYYVIIEFLCCLASCQREYRECVYYSSGEVKEELIFPTKEDKKTRENYKYISYYKNGEIHVLRTVENRLTNGACLVMYENGSLDQFKMYRNDTLHGVYKEFSSAGKQTREALYLNGIRIIDVMIDITKDNQILYDYYFISDEYYIPYGFLTYDGSNEEIVEAESVGCKILGKDTINANELYLLEIKNYMSINAEMKKVIIGDYDSTLIVKDSFIDISAESNKILYEFKPIKLGYNFLVGKVYLQKKADNVTIMYPVYKLFYVKGKNDD